MTDHPATARVGIISLAWLVLLSIDLAESRAQTGTTVARNPTIPKEITCGLGRRSFAADTTFTAVSDVASHASMKGKVVGEILRWKTISLGTHKTVGSLRRALDRGRCNTGWRAAEVLAQSEFTIADSRREIDLTILSVAELGFGREGASLAEIHARAAQLGLELCPAEAAPQLRLQYLDQPLGEFLHIAMEPIVTDRGGSVALSIGNGGAGLVLIGREAHSGRIVPAPVRFVFVRPR